MKTFDSLKFNLKYIYNYEYLAYVKFKSLGNSLQTIW
jgi:hypothetical protein